MTNRRVLDIFVVGCWPLLALAVYPATVAAQVSNDHHLCYAAPLDQDPQNVMLWDQWYRDGQQFAVRNIDWFCNPLMRKATDPGDNNLPANKTHLTCYVLERVTIDKTVTIKNQFVAQGRRIKILAASRLCLPTVKKRWTPEEEGTIVPKGTHYLCYDAHDIAGQPGIHIPPLFLRDQWGARQGVQILALQYFCNPLTAKKKEGGEPRQEFEARDTHLACYEVRIDVKASARIKNQFTPQPLRLEGILSANYLCLPTEKVSVDPK